MNMISFEFTQIMHAVETSLRDKNNTSHSINEWYYYSLKNIKEFSTNYEMKKNCQILAGRVIQIFGKENSLGKKAERIISLLGKFEEKQEQEEKIYSDFAKHLGEKEALTFIESDPLKKLQSNPDNKNLNDFLNYLIANKNTDAERSKQIWSAFINESPSEILKAMFSKQEFMILTLPPFDECLFSRTMLDFSNCHSSLPQSLIWDWITNCFPQLVSINSLNGPICGEGSLRKIAQKCKKLNELCVELRDSSLESLAELPELNKLCIANADNLEFFILSNILCSSKLTELGLFNCPNAFKEMNDAGLGNRPSDRLKHALSKIVKLEISNGGLTNEIASRLADCCPNLREINFKNQSKITLKALVKLSECRRLEKIILSQSDCESFPEESFKHTYFIALRCKNLQILDVSGRNITFQPRDLSFLLGISKSLSLHVANCKGFNDELAEVVAKQGTTLKNIDVRGTSVTSKGLGMLAKI